MHHPTVDSAGVQCVNLSAIECQHSKLSHLYLDRLLLSLVVLPGRSPLALVSFPH